jgi:beta-phosphoglucomutase-like phosphatase (HAD superfamily)
MPVIRLDRLDAVVFDTDGVLTDTARVHAGAWAELFDAYLRARAARLGEPFRPFTPDDYRRLVDGRPRYDGVAAFLGSRGIDLPWGDPATRRAARRSAGSATPRTAASWPCCAATAPGPSRRRRRWCGGCGRPGR